MLSSRRKNGPKDSAEQDPINHLETEIKTKDEVLPDLRAKRVRQREKRTRARTLIPHFARNQSAILSYRGTPSDERDQRLADNRLRRHRRQQVFMIYDNPA